MSKYRKSWETKQFLKDWIQEVPNDNTKAYCRACKIKLYAHRYSVLKHTATKKHQDNYEKLLRTTGNGVLGTEHPSLPTHRKLVHRDPLEDHVIEVSAEEQQEYLLEEAVIEGDALVYNESIDVFLSKTNDDNPPFLLQESTKSPDKLEEYDIASDALPTEINSRKNAEEEALTLTNESKMDHEPDDTRTISSHILDTSVGKAAANVEVTVFRMDNSQWVQLKQTSTNEDGRCSQLVGLNDFRTGIYKLHFNVRPYFAANQVRSFYPFIEIVIECVQGEHYHVPLLLNPFGYSTYRGT